MAFASNSYLFAGRIDAQLNLDETTLVTSVDTSFRDVVLLPDLLAYQSKKNFDVSRAVMRTLGEQASPLRRRMAGR